MHGGEIINMDHTEKGWDDVTRQIYLFLYIPLQEAPLCTSAPGSQISWSDNSKASLDQIDV